MKMKELEARTGVGRETIRYYIREGLLSEPERPKRNVAVYDDTHVRRVSLIKRLQHERFLPLAKIKDMLHEGVGELDAEQLPSLLGLEFLLSARFGDEQSRQPVALSQVAEASGITLKEIEEMDRIGLVSIAVGGTMSKQDADIVGLWGQMKEAGFTEEIGYSVTELTRFVETANGLAAQDVENFFARLPTDTDAGDATSLAEAGIILSNDILGRLRLRAIIREVAEHNARLMEVASAMEISSGGGQSGSTPKEKKKA